MKFKMIGYGKLEYLTRSGQAVEWPAVGIALQKNYIRVYLSLMKEGAPLLESYSGKLGEARAGSNNFSFEAYEESGRTPTRFPVSRSWVGIPFRSPSLQSSPRKHEAAARSLVNQFAGNDAAGRISQIWAAGNERSQVFNTGMWTTVKATERVSTKMAIL